jgi:peptide/nickel transport system substrate-binding protein
LSNCRWSLAVPLLFLFLACAPIPSQAPSTDDKAPKSGGALTRRIPVDPNDWDITLGGKGGGVKSYHLAYDTLLGFRLGPDVPFEELTLQPELADKWEVSPDATVFTFHLRKGVKFAP